jgi:dienelactone hydrolase
MIEPVYPDFERAELTFEGTPRLVFWAGSGPGVVVIHEAPGLYPPVVGFARRLIESGFRVYLPSLIGQPGREFSVAYSISTLFRACISREFTVWATGQNSPITDWLRGLAQHVHQECKGRGVGAIGMCLTGGFALAMMVDDFIQAPVLSQPSIPFAVTRRQKRDLGIDDVTLTKVKQRVADGVCVLGLRFTRDRLVPDQRFQRLRDELGDGFLVVEIDSSSGNAAGISRLAHSVLGFDYVDKPGHPTRLALDQVIGFLRKRLC